MDSAHKYATAYLYDGNGRRESLELPTQLRPTANEDLIEYTYDVGGNGAIKTVTDPRGYVFTYNYDGTNQLTSLNMPAGMKQSLRYALDGTLETDSLTKTSGIVRLTDFNFDAAGRLLRSSARAVSGLTGPRDTLTAKYSSLGHLRERLYVAYDTTSAGDDVRYFSSDTMSFDALDRTHATIANVEVTDPISTSHLRFLVDMELAPNSGRLRYQHTTTTDHMLGFSTDRRDTVVYNPAGDVEFFTQDLDFTDWGCGETCSHREDRASYHDAEGRLRFVDFRRVERTDSSGEGDTNRYVFEEFRYDALGRRVLVLTRRDCSSVALEAGCNLGIIRRTVWDGALELGEIQMPDTSAYRENDTVHPSIPVPAGGKDPHSLFGVVIYTHGAGIDRPLTVTRTLYGQKAFGGTLREFDPFTIVPYWNTRGVAEEGGFGDGTSTHCQFIGGGNLCVKIAWQGDRYSDRMLKTAPHFWHGALLKRNEDGGGTLYKRNRYYDTKTGQFTQEDPIGVAGGLNLYGFAAGDPVNLSDPFGTNPWLLFEILSTLYDLWQAGATFTDADASGMDKGLSVLGLVVGGIAPGPGSAYVSGLAKVEWHHMLPKQFEGKFASVGLDIEDFTISMPVDAHRLKPFGLHTGPNNWNKQWEDFFGEVGSPSAQDILGQLSAMQRSFGSGLRRDLGFNPFEPR
jgi:RHS repeat-associated protein